MKSPIIPCLWFDNQSEEAANFYTSIFKDGKIEDLARYPEGCMMPEGTVMTVKFSIAGQEAIALNGGPYFKFTPANSFFVGCESEDEFDRLWAPLSVGGKILMEPDKYSFSEKFGWLEDRYGLSWQLGICNIPQYISPFLMFVEKQYGKAEEAMWFYCSVFNDSGVKSLEKYGKANGETTGTVQHASFLLNGQEMMAMDSGYEHGFTFSEAFSFYVYCSSQKEIDCYWDALSEGGEKNQCGWLKDRFGVSWQIVPNSLEKMMTDKDPEKTRRVTEALMQMTKLDMAALQKAYDGK